MTLDQLLTVQEHDSAIDRLVHRRANLPERQALLDCDDEQAHVEAAREQVTGSRHELDRDQKRLEDDVALIEDRKASENERLYSGAITAHKDLQAIQAELDVLANRQSRLEDELLELMVRAEPVDAELNRCDTALISIAERQETIQDSLARTEAEIDAEIDGERDRRASVAALIADEMMSEYERVRAACGGVGIAMLNAKTCEGCHLQLSAVAYDRVRKQPVDALVHCTECGRILVR